MIKKLRRRFITQSMIFFTIILVIVQVMFFVVTQLQTNNTHERVLNQALGILETDEEIIFHNYNILIVEVNRPLGHIRIISNQWQRSEASIQEMINLVDQSSSLSGTLETMDVQYKISETPFTQTYAFLDLSLSRQNITTTSLWMFGLSVVLWIISFIISRNLANKAVEPVIRSMDQQTQLVSNLAHELKNPLASISANSQILRHHISHDDTKWLQYIDDETTRMNELISGMLYLSQSDEKAQDIELEPLNVSEIINEVLLPLESLFFEQDKVLDLDIAPGLWMKGHKLLLKQLFSIIADNALKYSLYAKEIRVRAGYEHSHIVIEFMNGSDTIDEKHIEHLFERFYRVDESRSKQTGYGLGLSIAKLITQQHHGHISITSQGRVTVVKVEFPKIKKESLKL